MPPPHKNFLTESKQISQMTYFDLKQVSCHWKVRSVHLWYYKKMKVFLSLHDSLLNLNMNGS